MTLVGLAAIVCIAVIGLVIVLNPFTGRATNLISVVIDTPYVGQGVAKGTQLVMHGVKVGEVTAVSNLPGGGVRLDADLEKTPVAGLTDAMGIDFRPVNYFGVTGINLIAGVGGQSLRDGIQINTQPKGNFTLQALLSRLGEVSTDVLTPKLIRVVDRATRYTDALDPLVETLLIAANAVAQVQTVSTARLLANTTGLGVMLPSTVDSLVGAADALLNNNETLQHRGAADYSADDWKNRFVPSLVEASEGIFGAVGRLESTHVDDLLPVTDTVKALTDTVPPLIRPEGFAQMLAEVRSRFEKMYGGTPDQRALQVRIVLDSLPGVAAPLGAIGAPQ